MKKVFAVLLILTVGLGITSCSSDDDSDGPNYSVVGKWNITSYTIDGQEREDCAMNGVRQFKTDGSYLQDEYEENADTGVCEEIEDSPLIGTYTKSGDDIQITVGGLTKDFDIEFISETVFTLTESYNDIDFVYTFTKI